MITRIRNVLRRPPVVSVLRLSGPIGSAGRFNRALSDGGLAPLIEEAFAPSRLKAVALAINSPGGSPAQSKLIAARIRDLAAEKDVPVLAFCEDVAASGGYILACAADEIFVDENSIVGSIGVVSASFGLHGALEKLGVERRLQTAGDRKSRLDPFSPETAEDREWLASLQRALHENFIELVKTSRGDRLGEDPPPILFSGEVFLGRDAVEMGLADGVGRLRPVLRERFGEEIRMPVIGGRKGLLARLTGGGASAPQTSSGALIGGDVDGAAAAIAAGLIDELETRALWARYGL